MAQLWTTGPALYYVGLGAGRTPLFLGTSVRAPEIDVDHAWNPVVNDLGGTDPMDDSFQGSSAVIRLDLGRWNEPVLNLVRSVPNPAGTIGLNPAGDIGSLVVQEALAYPIWVSFPKAGNPAYPGMLGGYRFPFCRLQSLKDQVGTQDRKVPLFWYARRAFDPLTYTFLLYDHNVTGLPAPD